MKKLYYFLVCGMMSFAVLGFTGCSSDDDDTDPKTDLPDTGDDDDDDDTSDPQPGKLVLVSDGHTSYTYDSEGRFVGWVKQNRSYIISYDAQTITLPSGSVYNFKLNSNGYISEMSFSSEREGSKLVSSSRLTYDGNGHLTKVSSYGSGYSESNGERVNKSTDIDLIYTWVNGRMESARFVVVNANGETKTESVEDVHYNYGADIPNPLGLFSQSLAYAYDVSLYGASFGGLYGTASNMFPTSVTGVIKKTTNGVTEETPYDYETTYTFNGDGTLNKEVFDGTDYIYVYSKIASVKKSAPRKAPSAQSQKLKSGHFVFLPVME